MSELSEEKAKIKDDAPVGQAQEEPKQAQEQQEAPPEAPWSVPESQSPQIELPETGFEPLRPLEPSTLGEAIAESFMPETPTFEPILPELGEGETQRVPMNRPAVMPMGDVCPHGLAGMCVWCPRMPCKSVIARCLRYLLVKTEYGESK